MFNVAVTVIVCYPTVAGLLVQIEMRPLAALIVNSAAERLATPLAGVLEIANVIGPQNPGMLYAMLTPSRIVGV